MSTLYLVDGSNFLFRAFHAMPPMVTSTGIPTGAVRGLANMLLRLLGEYQPSHIAVVFDAGGRDKRAERLAAYKQNRKECPPELVPQFDLARRLVGALGVRSLDATDAEADDLIATLARRAQKAQLKVVIASSDKDLMQLCSEGEIGLLDTMKDEGRGKLYGPAEVVEKFGVPPAQLGDVLALMGDSSDNLPGVPGIGPKTAAQLIQSFGSIEELLRRIDDINVRGKDKVQAALRANAEQLRLVRELVALDEALDRLREDLDAAKQEVLYAKAETQNVRRRLEKDVADARAYAATGFARDILSVSDNLSRALDAIPAELREDEKLKGLVAGIDPAALVIVPVQQADRQVGRRGAADPGGAGQGQVRLLHQQRVAGEHQALRRGRPLGHMQQRYEGVRGAQHRRFPWLIWPSCP